MKLENQVVSLDLAKRIKELGVRQGSYFYWVERRYQRPVTGPSPIIGLIQAADINYARGDNPVDDELLAAAFTVAELGEMLPKWTSSWRDTDSYIENGVDYGNCYVCGREQEMKTKGEEFFVDTNEADARAKMLIYLLENKLITV